MSEKFGLIGNPLGHSLSPFIHGELFKAAGLDGEFKLYPIPAASEFPKDLQGFSVTIPYKEDIIKFLSRVDDTARMYGAVNCVRCNADGSLEGFNTDAYGFLKSIEFLYGGDPRELLSKEVTLLGCGGAARVAAFETILAGGQLAIAIRDTDRGWKRAKDLVDELLEINADASIFVTPIDSIQEMSEDLLINATPCGMFPHADEIPIPSALLENCGAKYVFDAIYNPAETLLLKETAEHGSKTMGGVPMLVYQAARAQEIWHGKPDGTMFEDSLLRELCKLTQKELNNFPNK